MSQMPAVSAAMPGTTASSGSERGPAMKSQARKMTAVATPRTAATMMSMTRQLSDRFAGAVVACASAEVAM